MKYTKFIRLVLSIIFLMTGVMKITFSQFGNAFSIQLVEAAIPFPQVMFWMIPILEIGIGLLLLFNYKTVFALFAIIPIMLVAVYVHIIVANPEAFPAQPQLPIIPIVILVMVVYLLVNESLNSSSLD